MQIGDIKSFKKAAFAFCLAGLILLAITFGSTYLGRYGFSFVPFSRWQANGLWWLLYTDFCRSVGGAMSVAFAAYIISHRTYTAKSKSAS